MLAELCRPWGAAETAASWLPGMYGGRSPSSYRVSLCEPVGVPGGSKHEISFGGSRQMDKKNGAQESFFFFFFFFK